MLYIGYYGVGKTTLAGLEPGVVTLSVVGFKDIDNWEEHYYLTAHHLEQQHKIVLCVYNGHLMQWLKEHNIPFKLILPAENIKDQWLEKLKNRAENTKTKKDIRTYNKAVECWTYEYYDPRKEYDIYEIKSMNYNLRDILFELENTKPTGRNYAYEEMLKSLQAKVKKQEDEESDED